MYGNVEVWFHSVLNGNLLSLLMIKSCCYGFLQLYLIPAFALFIRVGHITTIQPMSIKILGFVFSLFSNFLYSSQTQLQISCRSRYLTQYQYRMEQNTDKIKIINQIAFLVNLYKVASKILSDLFVPLSQFSYFIHNRS